MCIRDSCTAEAAANHNRFSVDSIAICDDSMSNRTLSTGEICRRAMP